MASSVYKVLSKLNPPILATIVLESEAISNEDERKLYTIKWSKLHLPQESNEGYFHSNKSGANNALKAIGMNLIDTPLHICHEFKQIGVDLPVLSKVSALEYYIRFLDEIFNHKTLPCHVSESRFGDVSNFASFVIYIHKCIRGSKKSREDITPDDIPGSESPTSTSFTATDLDTNVSIVETSISDTCTGVVDVDFNTVVEDEDPMVSEDDGNILKTGLIITVDENIHCLSDGKKIINSTNWKLFPQSHNAFLHEKLMNKSLIKIYTDGGYIFQSSEIGDSINVIHSVFIANLPPPWCRETQANLEDIDISWVHKLLKCISEDPMFVPYCRQLLQCYTLIPADNSTMYSIRSKILPMETNSPFYSVRVQDILRKLHVPFVDSSVLGSVLTNIDFKLPEIGNAQDVLKSVCLANMKHRDAVLNLNNEELTELFEIFGLVNYRDHDSITHIKSLPIFQTMNGNLIQLSSFTTTWIWNDDVCKVGIEEWIKNTKSVAFLDPTAPWNTINMQAIKHLGIREISLYEVYCRYIFRHFNTMSSATRLQHIKFISQNVYYHCKHHSTNGYSPHHQLAKNFIDMFESLPCIGDKPPLRAINSFYDHSQEIFTFFCKEDCFLPEELQHNNIYECLKFFGLITVPTDDDFLSYCRCVQTYSQVSTAIRASELLLKYLFTKDVNEFIIRDSDLISRVSKIPIGIVKCIPKLDAISTQKLSNYSITDECGTIHIAQLAGSSLVQCMHSVWTCRPLINFPVSCPFSEEVITRIKDLGILDKPTLSDAIQNLKNIACTIYADASRFSKETSSEIAKCSCELPEVVAKTMKCIGDNLDRATYEAQCKSLSSQLQNVKFIPVELPACGYVLVSPQEVLFIGHSHLTPYYPFLHPLIVELQPYFNLLRHIGVALSFNICHIHLVLKKIKDLYQDKRVDPFNKDIVIQATVKLTRLLKDTEDKRNLNLDPLYLLNKQDILTKCSSLVVFDISGDPPTLPAGLTYLNSLDNSPITQDWSPVKLLSLLPKELGLKSLRSILEYKMITATPLKKAHTCVINIE